MPNLKKLLSNALLLATVSIAVAQDIHFSQYNQAPLLLNPALAGLNNCDYRLALNARTQWNTVSAGNTYTTFGASGDLSIGKVTKFNSYAGIGLMISSDWAGALAMNTNRADLSAAYHFMLNKRGTGSFSAGIQVGVNHRGFNPNKITVDNQFDVITGMYNPALPTKENFARTNMIFIDAGIGGLYSQTIRQNHNLYVGFAANHLNQPNISWNSPGLFNDNGSERLYAKFTVHGGGMVSFNDKLAVLPSFVVWVQGPSQQFMAGANVRFHPGNSVSKTFIYTGLQYRGLLDALVLNLRAEYKAVSFGFSYDINLSKLTAASGTFGGPELSILYQGCMNRKPRPFFCPVM